MTKQPTTKADQLRRLREAAAEAAERANLSTSRRMAKRAAKKTTRSERR